MNRSTARARVLKAAHQLRLRNGLRKSRAADRAPAPRRAGKPGLRGGPWRRADGFSMRSGGRLARLPSRVLSGFGMCRCPKRNALKLISALRVRVEAIMMMRLLSPTAGSAECRRGPASRYRARQHRLTRSIWLTASRPVRTTPRQPCLVRIRSAINPLITTESSTTITRSGSCRIAFGVEVLANATLIVHHTALKRHH